MAAKFEATADYNAVVRELDKVKKEYQRLAADMQKVTAAADGHERTTNKQAGANTKLGGTFQKLGGQAASMIASYATMQTAIRVVGDAMGYVQQQGQKAVETMEGMQESSKRLAQVATSADDLANMEKTADSLAAKYGEQRAIVKDVVFSARSDNFEDTTDFIIKHSDVVDAQSQAIVAGKMPSMFGGQISAKEAISATLVGAEKSNINFEQMAEALPQLGEGGALTGASPAETIAVLSVMSAKFKSGKEAAARFKAFSGALSMSDEFGGQGIVGGYEALAGASHEAREKFLGSNKEVRTAFTFMESSGQDVRARTGEIQNEIDTVRSGGQSALTGKYLQKFDTKLATTEEAKKSIEKNRSLELLRRAKIREELAIEEQFGVVGAEQQIGRSKAVADLSEGGAGGFELYAAEKAAGAAQGVGASGEVVEAAAHGGAGIFGGGGAMGARFAAALFGVKKVSSTDNAAVLSGQQQR